MNLSRKLALILLCCLAIFSLALASACTPAGTQVDGGEHSEDTGEAGHGHDDEDDHGHDDSGRLPNDGAVVRIVAPADGATIAGNEIVVEIEVENFPLGEDGRHWHVYLDGQTAGMVGGSATAHVLRAVEPGQHTVEVFLGLGTHEELEDGASVTITVEG